ncbi:cupin domain-containing protein [Desulfovibrio litoralis]|uniref:Cupin domain-containing protein n=1 Tax=Desulfovibrio litoralis DSM 11393 TaxID=1121455 RepID=A0A1M7SFJ0_9BACT|nr:cupin domain-containing protein [Desulfovibrio litoralis]SHN57229.1 Cupin domain-containing protein [Desulfovibrio litoralis DSM 11393]
MKSTQVRNINSIEAQTTNRGNGNVYHVKPACTSDLLKKCTASFVELEPGNTAYGYHYHETNEEIFYIISGSGTVETINGDVPIKTGDILSFPTGKGGAHVVKNTSATENLIYLDFGTKSEIDIAHLPKVNQIMVVSESTFGVFDDSKIDK